MASEAEGDAMQGGRILFMRVGWMRRYSGLSNGDTISRGGAYVDKNKFGHEMYNFRVHRGAVYGYAQPRTRREEWERGKITLERLGAGPGESSLSGVLVVWVATLKTGGGRIVGWYRDATVYREQQPAPAGSDRPSGDAQVGYYVTTRAEKAVLLPPDERVFVIPQTGPGAFGQSNIWYADAGLQSTLRRDVLRYIESRSLPRVAGQGHATGVQPDPMLRRRVEQAATSTVVAYFEALGYAVKSVERDNVGWDLEAVLGKHVLRLEVKGLSGAGITTELTPNEYARLKEHLGSYRVCIVTSAVTKPALHIFSFSSESDRWEDSEGHVLAFSELIGARVSAPANMDN